MMFVFYDNSKWKWLITMAMMAFFSISCEDDTDNNTVDRIPLVIINETLYLDSFDLIGLRTIGGFDSLSNIGYRGIILYNSGRDYIAYDRACPYDVEKDCAKVSVDVSGLFLIDKCCKTTYNWDGTVSGGPGHLPLKKYLVSFDLRKQQLHITN